MGWRHEDIRAERRKIAEEQFAGADRDALLDHIADVETALFTLAYPLSGLDVEKGPYCSASARSKLFPLQEGGDESSPFCAFNAGTNKFEAKSIPDERLHLEDYEQSDSIRILDGSKLSDEFPIISIHQSAMAASIYYGAVFMGDVRKAVALLWPARKDREG